MKGGTGPAPPSGLLWGAVLVFSLMTLFSNVECQRIHDMMYESLYSGGACYRRLNGTHQIGCSSKRGGSVGIVHAVNGIEDVDWIIKNGTAGPYAAFLPLHLFTEPIINLLLKNSDKIAGVIVYNNRTKDEEKIESFTHEQRCPNLNSQWTHPSSVCNNGDADSKVWNPKGTGLMYKDYPFAMFYLPPDKRDDINKIHDCFLKFNSFDLDTQSSRSLCAIEMDSFMFAAINSKVCIRRSNINNNLSPTKFCDPLADQSIFTTLFSRGKYSVKLNKNKSASEKNLKLITPVLSNKPGSMTLVTATLDGTTMLEGLGGGAVTTVAGFVTLLATAQALGAMLPDSESAQIDKNVMFVLLNGETYDYIGSQRMAVDLVSGNFPYKESDPLPPISPMEIGLHIHIGQLQNDQDTLFAYSPVYNETDKNDMVRSFIESMDAEEIYGRPILTNGRIPPSPVHSFLRFMNSSSTKMASVVLANHGDNFKNKFYQSILDNNVNLQYKYLNRSEHVKRGEDFSPIFPDSEFDLNSIQVRLANISTSIAKALYLHTIDKDYNGSIRASPFIIDELLHCYLDTIACKLATVSQAPVSLPAPVPANTQPLSLYIGVLSWSSLIHASAQFTAFLTGSNASRSKNDCKRLENEAVYYEWVTGWFGDGVCIKSIINLTRTISPAFMEDLDYDYDSGMYSTWTESVWNNISLRILVKPARWKEGLIIGIGVTIFALSIILTVLGRRHVVWLIDSNLPENNINISTQPTSRVDC